MKQRFTCRGHHPWATCHAPCAGKNIKYSEGYTEEFCQMVHFCFLEYINKVAARNRCEPVPTPRIGDYDADYYDDARVGKRHYDNDRIETVAPYVDSNSLKNDSSFSGLRETAIDIDSSTPMHSN